VGSHLADKSFRINRHAAGIALLPADPEGGECVKPRRVYTAEFKREVLREHYETGASQIAIERKYNIGISCLSRWIKDEQANQQNAFPGHGRLSADKAEIARLQKELERGK
jgi:transposase